MSSQDIKNAQELNIIACLVEDYCTTHETSTSKAVERLILELEISKANINLLNHKVNEYVKAMENTNDD